MSKPRYAGRTLADLRASLITNVEKYYAVKPSAYGDVGPMIESLFVTDLDNVIAAAKAEATPPTEGLSAETLAGKLRSADASLRDELGRSRNRSASYWRDMAELVLVLVNTRAYADAINKHRPTEGLSGTEGLREVVIAAYNLVNKVRERHDTERTQFRYSVPYGEVNALQDALNALPVMDCGSCGAPHKRATAHDHCFDRAALAQSSTDAKSGGDSDVQ